MIDHLSLDTLQRFQYFQCYRILLILTLKQFTCGCKAGCTKVGAWSPPGSSAAAAAAAAAAECGRTNGGHNSGALVKKGPPNAVQINKSGVLLILCVKSFSYMMAKKLYLLYIHTQVSKNFTRPTSMYILSSCLIYFPSLQMSNLLKHIIS